MRLNLPDVGAHSNRWGGPHALPSIRRNLKGAARSKIKSRLTTLDVSTRLKMKNHNFKIKEARINILEAFDNEKEKKTIRR